MAKSFPQIGNRGIVDAVQSLIFIVKSGSYTVDELEEEMEEHNANRETDLFKDIDEFLDFTLAESNRSIQVIEEADDGVVRLTDEGRNLLEGNFQNEAFELFEKKSQTNFKHFRSVLELLDEEYIGQRNYVLGDTIQDIVTAFSSATGNQFAANTSLGILRDFNIIEQNNSGEYVIDQKQYAKLRGEPEELLVHLLEEHDHRISEDDLLRIVMDEWSWSENKLQEVIDNLKDVNRVYTDRSEGVNWVVLSS